MNTDNTAAGAAADPTQPSYYTDRAPSEEHALRADFARYYQMRKDYMASPTPDNVPLYQQARAIDARWWHYEDRAVRDKWDYLAGAVDDWQQRPDAMARFHDEIRSDLKVNPNAITPADWRSQQQARELTGNGSWEPEPQSAATTTTSNAFSRHGINAFASATNGQNQGMSR